MARDRGGTNYLIDTKEAVIVDVEATPARWSAEVAATKTMLERTRESFGLTPQTLAADAAYGSGLMLGWLMGHGIEPHIPILDHEHQTNGYFTRADQDANRTQGNRRSFGERADCRARPI